MDAARLTPGARVRVVAADEFYEFIDGWEGECIGWRGGFPEIACQREDGIKLFLVPAAQLEEIPAP